MYLVGELGRNELAVQTGDIGNRLVLGALSLASAGIGAVAKSELFHLGHHVLGDDERLGATWGSRASWLTLELTKSMAEPFLQAATQAPQPMQVAQS
jgi:hypothetical protein